MHARLFFRISKIKKIATRFLKTSFFLFFIAVTLLSSTISAFAQTPPGITQTTNSGPDNAPYAQYKTLFQNASLNLNIDWNTRPQTAADLIFTFNGRFASDDSWDKIADFDKDDVFLFRFCNVGTDGKPLDGIGGRADTCAISLFPYRRSLESDVTAPAVPSDQTQHPETIRQFQSLINTQVVKKIYHYGMSNPRITTVQNITAMTYDEPELTSFSVSFDPVSIFSPLRNKTLVAGQRYQADVWFCAARTNGLGDLAGNRTALEGQMAAGTDYLRIFGERCDSSHLAYFRAAGVQFTVPTTQADIDAANTQNQTAIASANAGEEDTDVMPNCHILNGWGPGTGSFVGCIAFLVYYGIFWPIKWFAGIMGSLFDFFLGYSLDDESYRAEFLVQAWRLVRDIANIFFIIILVYTGLLAVFNAGAASMKKIVPQIIINALIINFSLFFTRVLVDISNITARVFYNTMDVCAGECRDTDGDGRIDTKTGASVYKPLSEKLVSSFDPQRIFTPKLLTTSGISSGQNDEAALTDQDAGKDNILNRNSYATVFVIISLIAAAILFMTAIMFWKVAFFFLGRTVGLYLTMIFAPFAFLTRGATMPLIGGIKELSWKTWWEDLAKYATLAPLFVFFLYIIYLFVNTGFMKVVSGQDTDGLFTGSGFLPVVLKVTVPMLMVYFLIQEGVKIAQKYAGKVGSAVQDMSMKGAGIAGGVGFGTTALLGSRVIGGAARNLDKSGVGRWLRDKGQNSSLARWTLERLNRAQSGSFDVRQSTIGGTTLARMGVNANPRGLDALAGLGLGLSTQQREGGLDAAIERREKERQRQADLLKEKTDQERIDDYNRRQKEKREREVDRIAEAQMIAQFGNNLVEQWKKSDQARYEQEKKNALQQQQVQAQIAALGEVKQRRSVEEMDRDRRKGFAENLKKGTLLDRTIGKIPGVGAAIGTGVRREGDKKAEKKLREKIKIEEKLGDINKTLTKGFQDLIALEDFQNTARFAALNAADKSKVIAGEKSMYDLLTDDEKKRVDQKRKSFDKKDFEEHFERVKVREQSRYDMKELRTKYNEKKKNYANDPSSSQAKVAFMDALAELQRAQKHQKVWQDVDRYQEEQKKKLKGDDNKK